MVFDTMTKYFKSNLNGKSIDYKIKDLSTTGDLFKTSKNMKTNKEDNIDKEVMDYLMNNIIKLIKIYSSKDQSKFDIVIKNICILESNKYSDLINKCGYALNIKRKVFDDYTDILNRENLLYYGVKNNLNEFYIDNGGPSEYNHVVNEISIIIIFISVYSTIYCYPDYINKLLNMTKNIKLSE